MFVLNACTVGVGSGSKPCRGENQKIYCTSVSAVRHVGPFANHSGWKIKSLFSVPTIRTLKKRFVIQHFHLCQQSWKTSLKLLLHIPWESRLQHTHKKKRRRKSFSTILQSGWFSLKTLLWRTLITASHMGFLWTLLVAGHSQTQTCYFRVRCEK